MANDINYTFNPFSIGSPNSGAPLNIKIPTCPSYPPPVFVVKPKPKVHTNRSVSQDSMPELQSKLTKIAGVKSQIGKVGISNAINEEMAISKKQADEHQRIYGGGPALMNVPSNLTKDVSDTTSIRTLLPVRMYSSSKHSVSSRLEKKNESKSSVKSKVSGKSNLSDVSKPFKETQTKSENVSSKMSLKSHESTSTAKASIAKASEKSFGPSQSKIENIPSKPSVKDSMKSILSRTSKMDNVSSKFSVKSDSSSSTIKSKSTVKSSKKSMNISITKDTANISDTTPKLLESSDKLKDNDHLSKHSMKTIKETENMSKHSVHSKKIKPSFHFDIRDKQSTHQSILLKKEPLPVEGNQKKPNVQITRRPITLSPSEFRKSLVEEADEYSNRLKAGNTNSFRRFDSLIRTYTNTQPQTICRDDRMSQWYKEAVLS